MFSKITMRIKQEDIVVKIVHALHKHVHMKQEKIFVEKVVAFININLIFSLTREKLTRCF